MENRYITILLLLLFISSRTIAQNVHSDNGDGTYTNPLISADFPDPDVIRVGDAYYMVSTTMFVFPGVSIIKLHDLVNWEYCNAVPRFDFSDCYNLDTCNRYGHGQWATNLKYHNGKFYLLFITLNEGGFMRKNIQAIKQRISNAFRFENIYRKQILPVQLCNENAWWLC